MCADAVEMAGGMMIVADVSVVPLGEGTSVSALVKKAVKSLDGSGLKTMHGPMSTSLEAENLDLLLAAVRQAHEAVFSAGARRVVTTVKIDDRRDRRHSMASKMDAVK